MFLVESEENALLQMYIPWYNLPILTPSLELTAVLQEVN